MEEQSMTLPGDIVFKILSMSDIDTRHAFCIPPRRLHVHEDLIAKLLSIPKIIDAYPRCWSTTVCLGPIIHSSNDSRQPELQHRYEVHRWVEWGTPNGYYEYRIQHCSASGKDQQWYSSRSR